VAIESRADAVWHGNLMEGGGTVKPASGAFGELPISWEKRANNREGATSPEELLGAAHAACFSMALANGLTQGGHPPEQLATSARVGFQAGQGITGIHLQVRGRVPGIDAGAFREAAEAAKSNCPVSKALTGVEITLEAELEG